MYNDRIFSKYLESHFPHKCSPQQVLRVSRSGGRMTQFGYEEFIALLANLKKNIAYLRRIIAVIT